MSSSEIGARGAGPVLLHRRARATVAAPPAGGDSGPRRCDMETLITLGRASETTKGFNAVDPDPAQSNQRLKKISID
jgi:hypothetical protein